MSINSQSCVFKGHDGVTSCTSQASGYVEGSIIRIKLKSFLTYDEVEFRVGPYLNVIIGPNGTGKSAIVCAVCLGLAGKTQWLGRATDPRDFIKYSHNKARIEIELFNPNRSGNVVIVREIHRDKSNNWWLNGKASTHKAVEVCVKNMNIQMGNLCQFLPQEKVADFARMSQQELLENTEKSVGRDNLYDDHQQLKSARHNAKGLTQEVNKISEKLNQEKQKNARLEQDVKCYHNRKKFLEKVEVLKIKKPWLEYTILKNNFEKAKEERDRKNEELKKELRKLDPLERRKEAHRHEYEDLNRQTKEITREISTKSKDIKAQSNIINNKSEKMEDVRNDYKAKVKEEESRSKRIDDLTQQMRAFQEALEQLEHTDSSQIAQAMERVAMDLRKTSGEISQVQTEGETIKREIHSLRTENKEIEIELKKIQMVSNKRLETLRLMHAPTYDAVLWLREHVDEFQHPIFEPMILCLNVTNPEDAKLVETHISKRDLQSFVFESAADLDLFMKKMKSLNLRVNSVLAPGAKKTPSKPKHPITHYRKYGFERYMEDLFTCDDTILRYLREIYRVNNIPIGDDRVKEQIERIKAECPELTIFYTPEAQFSIKRSKYTNNVSSKNTAVREARALSTSVNVEREQALENSRERVTLVLDEKNQQYKILQNKSEELEKIFNKYREEKRTLMKQKDQKKDLQTQITTKQQRIDQISRENIDLKVEEARLKQITTKLIQDKCKCIANIETMTKACLEMAKEKVKSSLKASIVLQHVNKIEEELREYKLKLEDLDREVKELKEHANDLKQQAREKLIEAKRVASVKGNDDLLEELEKRGILEELNKAPDSLEELESEIHSMQARAESMFQVDEKVIRDFERGEREIEQLEKLLHEKESQKEAHQENIEEAKRRWLEPLTQLVSEINKSFSYFFSCLQCCGEVMLNVPENQDDYEKYGICIKVKFRDEENLRELTAHHQSGGERSVSTVLYMLALQELTKCPFRVVDEINQGMDPKNERKVFQLVVQTVCKRMSSQYLLLTPKLLPDLDYDQNMTVLCVYNGPKMTSHKSWSLTDFIARRASLVE